MNRQRLFKITRLEHLCDFGEVPSDLVSACHVAGVIGRYLDRAPVPQRAEVMGRLHVIEPHRLVSALGHFCHMLFVHRAGFRRGFLPLLLGGEGSQRQQPSGARGESDVLHF
jgi:hypothetical protein